MTQPGDSELLRRYVQREDQEAFSELVRRHVDLVFGTAFRALGTRPAAEDVSQDVFLVLARKAAWLTREGSLAGWLHRATVLEARRRHRTERRRQEREQHAAELSMMNQPDPSPATDRVEHLDEALLELGEKDRQAVLLRYFEHYTCGEVGRALGIREEAAQKRVSKALDQLTRRLRRRGVLIGATATSRALAAAAIQAPQGFTASVTAHAVLGAGTASGVSILGFLTAQLLTMTKIQTASLCLLVAAVPAGYQWRAATGATQEQRRLESQRSDSHAKLALEEFRLGQIQRRVASMERMANLARADQEYLRGMTNRARETDADVYRWTDASTHVRIPKTALGSLQLGGVDRWMNPGFPAATEPVDRHGVLSEALGRALSITSSESDQVQSAFAELNRDYAVLESSRVNPSDGPPPPEFATGDLPALTLVIEAFPDEGEILRQGLLRKLTDALGEERAQVLGNQAADTFRQEFHDFGAMGQVHTVALEAENSMKVWNATRHGSEASFQGLGSSTGPVDLERVPETVRPWVARWLVGLGRDTVTYDSQHSKPSI